ncbi:MAG TPA: VOC family protein [Candidatus Paceibacterota bacterium]|jgi:Uncharacterized protein conserved in bacteria
MATIHSWINFNGNAEEAFTFYKSIFGGECTKIVRFKDLASSQLPVSDADAEKLMRIALPIGKNGMLFANDVPSFMGKTNEHENRSKILVNAETKEEADAIFNGLSEGGEVEAPMSEGGWGAYFGMLRDKYGIEWMIEFSAAQ